jgi:hypothetical protein
LAFLAFTAEAQRSRRNAEERGEEQRRRAEKRQRKKEVRAEEGKGKAKLTLVFLCVPLRPLRLCGEVLALR